MLIVVWLTIFSKCVRPLSRSLSPAPDCDPSSNNDASYSIIIANKWVDLPDRVTSRLLARADCVAITTCARPLSVRWVAAMPSARVVSRRMIYLIKPSSAVLCQGTKWSRLSNSYWSMGRRVLCVQQICCQAKSFIACNCKKSLRVHAPARSSWSSAAVCSRAWSIKMMGRTNECPFLLILARTWRVAKQ